MRGLSLIVVLGLLGACAPEPRSASYFKAHHEEAARVAAACKTGRQRGAECDAAEAGVADAQLQAEMAFFRRGF